MRVWAFASRNSKEILRDPLTLAFGIGLPVIMLCLFSVMQDKIPASIYQTENLTPAIAVFSFSFIALFSGLLIGKDKGSSFLTRIFASPMRASDYLLGYALPLLPIAMLQAVICFAAACLLGMPFDKNILLVMLVMIPIAILYIGFGVLFGTLFTDKQVGGVFTLFVNITTWLSGTWFDLQLMGGVFEKVGYALPFAHAVDAARAAMRGDITSVFPDILWVLCYAAVVFTIAVLAFQKRLRK